MRPAPNPQTQSASLTHILNARVLPEGGGVQNGQLNRLASGGVAEKDPDPDGTKVTFLSAEERGQSKASVIQVFKKVTLARLLTSVGC